MVCFILSLTIYQAREEKTEISDKLFQTFYTKKKCIEQNSVCHEEI